MKKTTWETVQTWTVGKQDLAALGRLLLRKQQANACGVVTLQTYQVYTWTVFEQELQALDALLQVQGPITLVSRQRTSVGSEVMRAS